MALLAITGASVWDGTGAAARPATVLIADERIEAVGDVPVPPTADRIDGSGKTVIPGLVDMHVHVMLCGEDSLFGFLGTGITTVRDLGSAPEVTLPIRDAIAREERVGPRMVVHGPMLDGQPSIFGGRPGSPVATSGPQMTWLNGSVEEGVANVNRLIEMGVDGIKLYAGLRPDLVAAMIRAVDQRVPVTGHLGRTWASEAIEAGIDCLEHVHATCYQDVVRLEDRHGREDGNGARANYWTWLSEGWSRADLDAPYVKTFIDQIVASRVVLSPTTVLVTGGMATNEAQTEPGQRWRTRAMKERAVQQRAARDAAVRAAAAAGREAPSMSPIEPEMGGRALANELEFLRRVHAAGGIVVPSTDVGAAPGQVPGFALHRELALLVRAGISASDVLQGATRVAAETMRLGHEIGTVEAGKRADLLVLDADPLVDIEATRSASLVISNGRQYRPSEVLARIDTSEPAG
ncbi:MAG: hypothetical protein EPO65_03335 [Dehalococcoidia bacterium]|nr:MAG: hypothetical protein EPO65_03335 [Dehalococcoidia bacterium]